MSQTLSEIVSSALRQADASIKVASLREAPIEDRSFARVDDYLARELGQREVETQKQASAAPATESFTPYDDIQFALKLAEALEHGALIVEKLAGPLNKSDGGVPTPAGGQIEGPAPIQPHNFDYAVTRTPIPQASAHARRAQANPRLESEGNPETDRELQLNDGPVIPSNYPTSRLPTTGATTKRAATEVQTGLAATERDEFAVGKKKDKRDAGVGTEPGKHAALDRVTMERLLKSKIAQHKMLVSLGQIDAAEAVLKEAAELTQVGAPHDHSPLVFRDNPGIAGFPDNEQVRALTKAQARDMNQREAGSFFGEPVKRDSAALAHLAIADGLKLSSMPLSVYKQAGAGGSPGFFRRTGQLVTGSHLKALKGRPSDPTLELVADTLGEEAGAALKKKVRDEAAKDIKTERLKVWGTRGGLGAVGVGGAGLALRGRGRSKRAAAAAAGQGLLHTIGSKVIGGAQWGTRKLMHGAGAVSRSYKDPALGKAQIPRQQGMLERGADYSRRQLAEAHRSMNEASDATRKWVGAGAVGAGTLGAGGTAYGGYRMARGGRRDDR